MLHLRRSWPFRQRMPLSWWRRRRRRPLPPLQQKQPPWQELQPLSIQVSFKRQAQGQPFLLALQIEVEIQGETGEA